MGNLEDFFGVSKEKIKEFKDKAKERRIHLTVPKKIEQLENELHYFETPKGRFMIYAMINNPSVLSHQLNIYSDHGGEEDIKGIINELIEYCVFGELLSEYKEIQGKK
jgi:hypothetical protein